jgi:hypothetical protein
MNSKAFEADPSLRFGMTTQTKKLALDGRWSWDAMVVATARRA